MESRLARPSRDGLSNKPGFFSTIRMLETDKSMDRDMMKEAMNERSDI
jgi:hypothetical protein